VTETDRDFRDFVAAHLGRLRALAYVTCGDWQLAEDAVATVLSKMYPRWQRIQQPAVYARQAVVRTAITEKRRPWWRRERVAGDELPEVSLADQSRHVDDRLQLHAAHSDPVVANLISVGMRRWPSPLWPWCRTFPAEGTRPCRPPTGR
jgi:DNA-directed RNA polymerase specialized sigma24 family protein